MKAVDTNLIVRIITEDDVGQALRALEVVGEGVLVTSGVWIETEWVLRSTYKMPRPALAAALAQILVLDGVEVPHRGQLEWALDRYSAGADWADLLHLIDSQAASAEAFVTFDRGIQKSAAGAPIPVEVIS